MHARRDLGRHQPLASRRRCDRWPRYGFEVVTLGNLFSAVARLENNVVTIVSCGVSLLSLRLCPFTEEWGLSADRVRTFRKSSGLLYVWTILWVGNVILQLPR